MSYETQYDTWRTAHLFEGSTRKLKYDEYDGHTCPFCRNTFHEANDDGTCPHCDADLTE